jgi:hypothetical protein
MSIYVPSSFVKDEKRADRIPIVFGIKSPFGDLITDFLLILHINPDEMTERKVKKINRTQTKGGWIEYHWGDELDELSATQSTGSFFHAQHGLTGEAMYRRDTIAYDRFKDILDLYQSNGSVQDDDGTILFQGDIIINYAGAGYTEKRYEGYFNSFSYAEDVTKPWLFSLTWNFKVKRSDTYVSYPGWGEASGSRRRGKTGVG